MIYDSRHITVVIPVFNRAAIVTRTLDSVAAQDAGPLRLIVVDNNSGDDTVGVVRRWVAGKAAASQLDVTLLSETEPGAAAARNCGLRAVTTPWVMFFDSDDTMMPGHVSRALVCINSIGGEVDIVGWDVSIELAGGARRTGRFDTRDMAVGNLLHGFMSTQRYCVRTGLVRQVGGWDVTARVWDDMELGVRLLCRSPRVLKAGGEPTVVMYFTGESITGTRYDAGRCSHTLDLIDADLIACGEAELSPWVAFRRALLAAECRRQGDIADSRRMLAQAVAGRSPRMRMALRAAYLHALTLRRGAYLTFRLVSGL